MANILEQVAKLSGAGILADKLGLTGGDDDMKMLGAESVMPSTIAGKAAGMKKGGKVSSASSRADGCCTKGKTKGKYL
jgi:hypothetical protein